MYVSQRHLLNSFIRSGVSARLHDRSMIDAASVVPDGRQALVPGI